MDDDRKAERRDREIMAAQAHREQRQRHAGGAGQCDADGEGDQNGTPSCMTSRVET